MTGTIAPTKTKPVFFAKAKNLRLVRCPRIEVTSPVGSTIVVAPGLAYQFEDGYFEVTDDARARDADYFERYGEQYPSLDTRPVDEWLRGHELLGASGTGGFIELRPPAPPSAPVIEQVIDLALAGDEAGLVALHEEESEGWERPDVFYAIERALTTLDQAKSQGEAAEGS